ncbi:hypothetical protein ACHAWF_005841 [Thalassiosira exigua]
MCLPSIDIHQEGQRHHQSNPWRRDSVQIAALLGTALLGTLLLTDKTFKLYYDNDGLLWSVMAGLAVGLAEMLSFVVSGI